MMRIEEAVLDSAGTTLFVRNTHGLNTDKLTSIPLERRGYIPCLLSMRSTSCISNQQLLIIDANSTDTPIVVEVLFPHGCCKFVEFDLSVYHLIDENLTEYTLTRLTVSYHNSIFARPSGYVPENWLS